MMYQEFHDGNMPYIAAFRKGNTTAFSYYYHLFYIPLRYFAEQLIKDKAASDDIVADVFIKLWQKHAHFPSEERIKSFLYICTRNACLDFIKHQRITRRSEQAIADNTVLQEDFALNQIIRTELYWHLYNAIEQLPTECRRIFKMSFLEEMKNQEIADKLSLSIKTVKNQKARAIVLIRKRLLGERLAAWALWCAWFITL